MKAVPFEEKRLSKWHPPFIVQPKYDGVRCRAVPLQTGVKGNEYMLLSSEENILFSVPHLNEILSRLELRAELDGELYCHGMSFEEIVSITSRTINIHPDHKRIQFHCFDIVNDQPQMRRQLLIEALRGLTPWIEVTPFYLCENLDDVLSAYDKIIERGYEGIIVRNVNAPYERKRSVWVMKFKPKKEDIYPIVAFQEETDKDGLPKGSLGAITCVSGDGNVFNVGSGFSAKQRQIFWEIKETLPGRSARIRYQHLTSGRAVPRFQVFMEIV